MKHSRLWAGVVLVFAWLVALTVGYMYPRANARTADTSGVAFSPSGSANPVVRLTAAMPDPQVAGQTFPRSVVVSGLQFLDLDGNEMGGLGTIPDGRRAMILCFDYETAEAVCLTRLGEDVTLSIMDLPPLDAAVGQTGPERFRFGLEPRAGISYLRLMDRQGRVRIRLEVDSTGAPRIQALGPDGTITFSSSGT